MQGALWETARVPVAALEPVVEEEMKGGWG